MKHIFHFRHELFLGISTLATTKQKPVNALQFLRHAFILYLLCSALRVATSAQSFTVPLSHLLILMV
jgi:hypothetical protein